MTPNRDIRKYLKECLFFGEAQAKETIYLNECKILLQQIGKASVKAVDELNKFDIKSNSDKICILSVGNNFAQNLEYVFNKLQRIIIDNNKRGHYNKNLKDSVQEFSSFAYSIQLEFGNDLNKLKLIIINVLKNLSNKLNLLFDILQEHSPYSSKWEIVDILDYLYIAIEKVKMRTQWEHLDYKEIINDIEINIFKTKLEVIDYFQDKEYLITHCRRFSYKALEGILTVLQETIINLEYYDDNLRNLVSNTIDKISDSVFESDRALRDDKGMTDLIMYVKLCTKNVVLSLKEVFLILKNENLVDSNSNIRNFVYNTVVNGLSCSIRFTRDLERILQK